MRYPDEKRASPSIRETLTFKKEIPLVWLLTLLVGGLANFAALIWIAASIVNQVGGHEKAIAILETRTSANNTLIAAQTVLIQAQLVMINDTKEGLSELRERFNRYSDRRFNR